MSTLMSPTIVRLGLRSIFGRWRGVLLFVLPLVLLGLAVLVRVLVGAGRRRGRGHPLRSRAAS